MAAFPLPAGHPFTAVRPGYAGYETSPGISILNATASYIGAVGDYPNSTVTLQLFATFGGTWAVTTPPGLTLQTPPVTGQAYTAATYTGGTRGSTYTFTSITLTPPQGSAVAWTGIAPSVTLEVPNITTTISPSGSYYIGGNAIYLEPLPANFGVQTILGLTDYVFACTTSAAYATVDSVGIGVIPFPSGTVFAPGTTTALDFTVACRSNGIIGVASAPYTVSIVSPAVPSLTVQSIIGTTINFSFFTTTPGCTFNLRYNSAIIASNITSPYGYNMQVPGIYTFSIQAVLSNLSAFSIPSTTTVQPPQPTNVVATLVAPTTVSLAWTSLGGGYTYNVSETGIPTQNVQVSTALFTGLSVGAKTFYVQSVYGAVTSTTCNIQLAIDTRPPTNFIATTDGATIALNWLASPTPGTIYNITSVAAGNVAGVTGTTYSYTSLSAGAYSFAIVGVSGGIQSSSLTTNATVVITTPTNLVATTTGTTANLTWQDSITGTTFSIVWSGPQTGTATSGIKSATITGLTTPGVYTFSVRSLYSGVGSPSPPITTTATIVTAPTSFTAVANGNVITLGWSQSTPNCSFLVSSALGNTTTTNTTLTYPTAPVGSYTFSLTPTVIGTSFVGPSVTTTNALVFNGPSPVVATLSGPNVNVAWTAIAGCTYTVSSSPVITDAPPAPPGTSTSVQFVVPNPQTYTFTVLATDASGNISIPATSSPLLVPLPAPINIGSTMTASSVVVVTWTEQQDQCSFIINGVPAGITPEISLVSSILSGGLPAYNYQGILRGVPTTTGLTFSVVASLGGVNSVASSSVTQYTFSTFNVTLSATCSQSGSINNVTAAYTMTSPAAIYGPGVNGGTPYTANMVYSQAGTLTPAATSGPSGTYGAGFYGMGTAITNTVPTNFGQFVVPPTNIVVTAIATNLLVKWTDSTTNGCSYRVVGSPGTFAANVAAGTGSTGLTFTGATIGTAYTFVITAFSAGSYTASRTYGSVTTENATVPYTITSVSVPSTAVTPINFPSGFAGNADGTLIQLLWNTVPGATSYSILNGGLTLVNAWTGNKYSFTGAVGTVYSLALQAVTGSTASNITAAITVIPQNNPTFSYFLQAGSNLTVGTAISPSGPSLSINTPTGLSAPTASAGAFTFTNVAANTTYSFTVTATGTNATSTATSSFTTMATPVITSATAQGTATITVNWTYAATAPAVDGFSVYYNDTIVSNVASSIRSVVFNQTAQTNNTDTVYVVARIGTATSRPSATVSVTDLATIPIISEASITGNAVTVKWSYATSGRALSIFQVWNSTLTTTYGNAVSYSSTTSTYTSFFTVTNGTYIFKVVGTDSLGSTVTSANSPSVTNVARPIINSVIQTGSTIVVTCASPPGGVTLSIPSTPTGLTASSSTTTTFTFSGAAGSTTYSFTVQSTVTGGSTDSATSSITTVATPGIPTVSASGTTVTVNMPSYSSLASFLVYNGSTLVASAGVGATSTTFTGVVGTTYALTVVATIGANSSIASPSPLTSPLSAASGCILWLDGADPNNTGSPVANGTTITTWIDKSGNANNAASGSGTITVTGNSLVFDGTSKFLRVPGIAGKIVNTPFVIFIVETFAGAKTFPRSPASLSTALSGSLPVVGNGSIFMAVGSDNSFYMGVFTESKLYKISSAPNYTITDITTGSGVSNPTSLLRALDGNIFIVNGGNGSIHKYNITTGVTTVFAAAGTTYNCFGITEAPDGTVYAANQSSFSIQVIPSTGWSGGLAPILVSFTAGLRGIVYANDGFLYVSMEGGNLYRVNPTTGANTLFMNTVVRLNTLSQGPDGFIYGNSLAVIYTLSITDQTYLATTNLLTTATLSNQRFGPDGTLYICDTTGRLYRVLTYNPPYRDGSTGRFYFGDDNVNNSGATEWSLHTGYRAINNQTFAMYGSDLEDYSIIPQTGETRIWALYLPGGSANRNTRRNGNIDVTFTNNAWLRAFTAPTIGRIFGASYFSGTIAEILVFPSDIGIPAIQRIEQYLANKWRVSAVSGVVTPLAASTATASVNGGTITVTCGTPTAGTVLNIPTTPTGLTRSSYTATTFTYTGAVGGTSYSFAVYAYNGPATSLVASTSATALYKPGTPTVTATGTTVNVSWTYTGTSYTGITFSIVYSTATVAATTITTAVSPTSLTASFIATAAAGEYTVYVYASSSSGSNRSDNSASAFITIIGTPTLTQNYQLTTQTKIVATIAATNATSYAGTGGTLSAPAVSGSTLTWTGATAGTRYTGVSVQGIKGTTTTTTTGLSIYSAFDPKSIPGCIIWMDAADTTTYTPGTNVTAWTNKGTFSVTGSTTAGTFNSTSTTINNLPAMAVSAGASMYIGGMTYTTKFRSMFFVLIMGAAGGTTTTYLLCGGAFSPTVYSQNNSDIQFNYEVTTTNLLVTSNPTSFFGARSILSITSGIYVNGAAQTLSTTNANLGQFIDEYSSTLTIGKAAPSGTAAFTLGEVLLYDGALNTTQRQAIEGYLAWKWGLQGSLSSTNPYSTLASPSATAPPLAITAPTSVDYLVIGGGGGGGSRFGGGGGAGGFLSGAAAVAPSTSYTVTVGAGGAGGASSGGTGTPAPANGACAGADGSPSVFGTITAAGGGGGAYGDRGNGRNGGSGGGGAGRFATTGGTGTAGQGNAGGTNGSTSYVGGAGGGAGGAAVTTVAGTGRISSITGVSVTYAGGGGGGGTADGSVNGSAGGAGGGGTGGGFSGTSTPPTTGTANTGSGGGGGAYNLSYTGAANGPNNQPGAAGGSGVVILSYSSTFNTIASITGTLAPTTPSIVGTNIVYRFTSGTGTIRW